MPLFILLCCDISGNLFEINLTKFFLSTGVERVR